ncbi:hypothetical protein [Streptomyces sp. NPDC005336]|uniref:hypothetical protein n=1 Tax=Streptomyces sp. NPDC005336 TaxID=3157035 RepID=UPI0033B6D238
MSTDLVRPRVAAAAQERGLGREIAAREVPGRPVSLARGLILTGLAALPLSGLLMWVVGTTGLRFLITVPLAVLAYGLVAPVIGVRTLIRQPQSWYVFDGGLVRYKGDKLLVLPWGDIAALTRRRVGREVKLLEMKADNLKGYHVRTRTGDKAVIDAYDHVEEQARFCAALEQTAQLARITITG